MGGTSCQTSPTAMSPDSSTRKIEPPRSCIARAAPGWVAIYTETPPPLRMALTLGSMMISYPAVSAIVRGRSNP